MKQLSSRLVCKINMIKFGCFAFSVGVAALLTTALNACDSEKALTPTQNAVHGAVVDQNGKPISGAVVAARRAHVQAVTDESGEYSLPKVESLDGSDTLDMTDNKLIRVAMPISWKVKRFEDAVVVKRKVTGSVAGDLGGLSKARIHWRTRGTVEGIPQVVDLVNGGYQGEIATLFSKDSLEVQVFLLDTALRVVGKSRFLQINPRSGNIVVPAFPKLNTFESLSPVYGCGQMGSWDTCTVRLTQPEDSSTRMWFREGGEVWTEFQGAFVIPPRLRRIAPWVKERLHTEIEILRKDSIGVERLDTIRIPWKKHEPFVYFADAGNVDLASKIFYEIGEDQSIEIIPKFRNHSPLVNTKLDIIYGTHVTSIRTSGCSRGGCTEWYERVATQKGQSFNLQPGLQSFKFPEGSNGSWYMVLRATNDNGEMSFSDTVFVGVRPAIPEYPIASVKWEGRGLQIQFVRPVSSVDLMLTKWGCDLKSCDIASWADSLIDDSTVVFYGLDSLFVGDSLDLLICGPGDDRFDNAPYSPKQRIWVPRSEENLALEEKLRSSRRAIALKNWGGGVSLLSSEVMGGAIQVSGELSQSCAKECGVGVVFWSDTSMSPCLHQLRFNVRGSDSTILRVFSNIKYLYEPSMLYGDSGYRSDGKEYMLGETQRAISFYDSSNEDRLVEWDIGWWGDWNINGSLKVPLRQTVIAAFCGNLDPANCAKERWLSVSDIEVYSDCTEPLPGVVP